MFFTIKSALQKTLPFHNIQDKMGKKDLKGGASCAFGQKNFETTICYVTRS